MLADFPITVQAGELEEIHLPRTARYSLLEFIAHELPHWRDHPGRKTETAETALTDQLCSYLNSAARLSDGWSRIQFRTEVPDEVRGERSIDLAPKPCGAVLIVEGRRHTQFDTLLPIECKRLPTPKGKDRDEREYVITARGSTGGIQRFKLGHHGATHCVAGMIAYVQEKDFPHWLSQVNDWIRDLSSDDASCWSDFDLLRPETELSGVRECTLHSRHERQGELGAIELRHLWVAMN